MIRKRREIWREVPGYEGYYSVSSFGRVRRDKPYRSTTTGLVLRAFDGGDGYLRVRLSKENVGSNHFVHVLVAAAFLGPKPRECEVRHGNGVRNDPRLSNLCYGTKSENYKDSVLHGTAARGSRQGLAKLTEEDIPNIRKLLHAGVSKSEVARRYEVHHSLIVRIGQGRIWAHIV